MRYILYSYFSQQDKLQNKFRLESDSGFRIYSYLAKKLAQYGHDVTQIVPKLDQCADPHVIQRHYGVNIVEVPYDMALCNAQRRIEANPSWLKQVITHSDIVLTQHETLALQLKSLAPRHKVVTEVGMMPGQAYHSDALIALSYKMSDALHCNSMELRHSVLEHNARAWVWQFGVPPDVTPGFAIRPIDVVFNSRASSTNYTNHTLAIRAFQGLPYNIRCTDPTRYMWTLDGTHRAWFTEPLDRATYVKLLQSSKVVLNLTKNGYGGWAFREAMVAGATPVCLDLPEHRAILGQDWPYYCEPYPTSVIDAITRAVRAYGTNAELQRMQDVRERVIKTCSYGAAWQHAKRDLETL